MDEAAGSLAVVTVSQHWMGAVEQSEGAMPRRWAGVAATRVVRARAVKAVKLNCISVVVVLELELLVCSSEEKRYVSYAFYTAFRG